MGRSFYVSVALALLALTAAAYGRVGRYGFIAFDDPTYVTANAHVQAGLSTASSRWAMTTHAGGNWSPLVWLSFMADRGWAGLRPGPMHVENVLLHAIGGLLLWGWLADATARPGRSAVVAGLFLCHPMHVESVAWISERKDVLSTPLLFAATWAFVRHVRGTGGRRWGWYAVALLAYGLSLSAKSMGVTWPALLLLLDVWPLGRLRRWRDVPRSAVELLPPLALAGAAAVVAVVTQRAVGAAGSLAGLGVVERVGNSIVCGTLYVAKLAVPTGLAVYYPHPGSRPVPAVAAAAGLLAMVTVAAVRQRHRRPYLLVGWLWFGFALLPVIGLVQVGGQAMADRYSYLPSVGLFVAAVWVVADAVPARVGVGLGAAALLAATVLAARQVAFWRDTRTLFAHAAAVTDDNWMAHLMLGTVAAHDGDRAAAIGYFEQATRERPTVVEPVACLAVAVAAAGDLDRAVRCYTRAIALDPTSAAFHVGRARALAALGHRDEAAADCRDALALDPSDAAARAGLADLERPR